MRLRTTTPTDYQLRKLASRRRLAAAEARNPERLIRGGKLCCLICCEPYETHPVTKSCYREAAI